MNTYKLWLHLEEIPADKNKDPRNMDNEYLPEIFGEYDTLDEAVSVMGSMANSKGRNSELLPPEFPVEQFQKIKRSDLDRDLLRMLQYRAWFTAGNPGVNEEQQIEKEFFINHDELDFIRQELYNEGLYDAANQSDELKKINVSYFHIIDQ